MKIVLLFDGQGCQTPSIFDETGLWPNWKEDWAVLSERAPTDKQELLQRLNQTEITQPAIVGYSYKAFYHLQPLLEEHEILACAGHSLGELTATAISLGWDLSLAMLLAQQRAVLMQHACASLSLDVGMEACLGRNLDKAGIQAEIDKFNDIWFLNDNSSEQIVIGGALTALSRLDLSAYGIKRRIGLPVSVLSHCAVLRSIQQSWEEILSLAPWGNMKYRFFNHSTVCFLDKASELFENLSVQLVSKLRFQEMIEELSCDTDLFIEVGASNVLKGIVQKITSTPCLTTAEAVAYLSKEKQGCQEYDHRLG